MPNKVTVSDAALRQAAEEGMDAFVDIFVDAINASVGGELTVDTMAQLNACSRDNDNLRFAFF